MTDLELIHGLVDGELEAKELAEARGRLESDADFRAHYDAAREQKAGLKSKVTMVGCPETWAKCRGRLDEIDRAGKAEFIISKYAWQMAACLMLFLVGVGAYNRSTGGQAIHAGSVTTAAAGLSSSVISPSRIESWLTNKLGIKANTPSQKIIFQSVSEGVVEGRSMWKVDLTDSGVPLSLVVIANAPNIMGLTDDDSENMKTGQINGLNCVAWKVREYTCVLMGDRQPSQLEDLAKVLVR